MVAQRSASRREIKVTDAMLQAALNDPANADLWMLQKQGLPKKPKRSEKQRQELFERLAAKPVVEEPTEEDPRPPSPEPPRPRLRPERLAELALPKAQSGGVSAVDEAKDTASEVEEAPPKVLRPAPPPRCAVPWQPPKPADALELGLGRLRVRSEVPVVLADGTIAEKERPADQLPPRPPRREEVAPPDIETLQRAEEVLYILVRVVRATPQGTRLRVAELFAPFAEGAFPSARFLHGLPTWSMAEAEPAVVRLIGRGNGAGDAERLQVLRDELLNSKITHIAAEQL